MKYNNDIARLIDIGSQSFNELPRKILIGNDVIYQLGSFIRDLMIKINSRRHLRKYCKARVGKECVEALDSSSLKHKWIEIQMHP